MSDFLKSVFDAWDERIRSPILGSFVIAYVVFNWQAFFILFLSEGPAWQRLDRFNDMTDWFSLFWCPLGLGLLLAIISPFLKFFGAWAARYPNKWLHSLQADEASGKRLRTYELEQLEIDARASRDRARENAIVEQGRRLKEAENVGEDVRASVLEERDLASLETSYLDLMKWAILARLKHMPLLVQSEADDYALTDVEIKNTWSWMQGFEDASFDRTIFDRARFDTEFAEALNDLQNGNFIDIEGHSTEKYLVLTSVGYGRLDKCNFELPDYF